MTTRRLCVLLAMAVLLVTGCSGLPPDTRTGKVYDIIVRDLDVATPDVVVGIGDEVRFRNEGSKPAYVFFFRDFLDELSCMRGFTLLWGTEEEAKIAAGQSASLCFNRTGTVSYRVQWEPSSFGGIGGTPGELELPPAIHGAIVVK